MAVGQDAAGGKGDGKIGTDGEGGVPGIISIESNN
jgi:hypothetical protein